MAFVKGFLSSVWTNRNYRSALLVFVILILWLVSGVFRSDEHHEASSTADKTSARDEESMTVKVRELTAQPYPITLELHARSEANREVSVRSETYGRVIAVPVREGEFVEAGTVLCELAMDERQIRVDEAQALVDAAKLDYEGALRLKSGGYQSASAIASAKAKWESAKANLVSRQLDLERSVIKAPFAGVINYRPVEIGDYLKVGDECALLLDMNPLKVVGRISETEISQIRPQDSVNVSFTSGVGAVGQVLFVESQADQSLRTFAVEVAVPNPDLSLRGGMSATLAIHTREVLAHQIPANVLALDDEGLVGVKLLDAANKVTFSPVKIIGNGGDSIWVTGLDERVTLISVGQEYVTVGQTVKPFVQSPHLTDAVPAP